ncbi:MAG: hypothetical protein LC115_00175 [Bacteroidia bacterium]|nr:hypothetical protein [Bacteroidia bacterium]
MFSQRYIQFLLWFLVLLDLFLSGICLVSPAAWGQLMHGQLIQDEFGVIRRLGAVWLAFLVFQTLALLNWKKAPYWLVLVAGIRLTEVFSDWFYGYFASDLSWFGFAGLLIAPPANAFFGWYLIRAYHFYQNNGAQ